MLYFENRDLLYLLLLIPAIMVVYVLVNHKKEEALRRYGNLETIKKLMPNVSYIRPHFKFGLMLVALGLMIFGMARPRTHTKSDNVKKRGIEAMFVLDISNSMLAEDIKPNRLDYAKLLLLQLSEKMEDDKIGLIVFAGDAFIQMPITTDNVSTKMFMSKITPDLINRQGTAIGSAIDLAIKGFDSSKSGIGRSIFLITDGENHEDDAIQAAKLAVGKGITVNVIGIGSPDGSPVPLKGTMGFIKDRDGNVVVSKLNEQMCRQIAESGNGIYLKASNSGAVLRTLEKELEKMQKGEYAGGSSDFEENFFVFVWIALLAIVLEFFTLRRQNKRLARMKLFNRQG